MPDILHRVGIDAKPEQVFNALTTINGLRGWWTSTAAGNAAKGGIINYGFCDMQGQHSCSACGICWKNRRGVHCRMTSRFTSTANAGE